MKLKTKTAPVVCIVGKSGSGKTTLMEKLIPELNGMGLRVGTIKHDMHGFEMDKPGKDSWRHKQAGSKTSIISSPQRIGMVMDVDHDHSLDELALFFAGVDIILAEGYKNRDKPKVEIFRRDVHTQPLCLNDETLIALMTDTGTDLGVPRFDINDITGLAVFLAERFELEHRSSENREC
jgi:molybdopterin-guanine dinucleotide biosynthesis protein B